jgi:hypothetical protein
MRIRIERSDEDDGGTAEGLAALIAFSDTWYGAGFEGTSGGGSCHRF